MNRTYTAIIQRRGDWWIGWIKEIPGVNCQEKTREELLDTLRITLLKALEFNRQEEFGAETYWS
ncbi:MAG: type II toxin-antitoxin system HicB family antitoxin [Candidatus Poribacteria bacterium]